MKTFKQFLIETPNIHQLLVAKFPKVRIHYYALDGEIAVHVKQKHRLMDNIVAFIERYGYKRDNTLDDYQHYRSPKHSMLITFSWK